MSREPLLRGIADTAHWVAHYRACESERADALFRDPHARALAGALGERIANAMPGGRDMVWAMAVRTHAFDELIAATLERDRIEQVLNLAAGLDARPYRLKLPAALRWIEVDSAELIAHKQALLADAAPVCALERVALDLADGRARRALFARLAAEGRRTLVITEGLVIYLSPEQVAELATDLHAHGAFAHWLTDFISPRQLRRQQRAWNRHLAPARASMRFGPAEGADFFRAHGWEPREVRSCLLEARRLGREMAPPLRWLVRWLLDHGPARERAQLRALVGYALLARSAVAPA